MHNGKHSNPKEFRSPEGHFHAITRQVFGGFICAMRESSKMHRMVNHYK